MESTIITPENIRAYIRQQLDGEQLTAFQAALKADESLLRSVNFIRGLYLSGQERAAWEELDSLSAFVNDPVALEKGRRTLDDLLKVETQTAKVVPLYRRTWFRAAAAILVLALVVWALLTSIPNEPGIVDAVPQFYQKGTTSTSSGIIVKLQTTYKTSHSAYENKNYQNVITESSEVAGKPIYRNDNEYMPRILLLRGMAQYQLADYKSANETLSKIRTTSDEVEYQAKYYQAIALYEMKQKSKALDILKALNQDAPEFAKEYKVQEWLTYLKKQ